jgi:hypothetical protein
MSKKIIIVCCLFVAIMTAPALKGFCQSEQHQGGGGHREPDYAQLKTDLSLTDDQVTSWKNLHEQYKTKFQELGNSSDLSEDDRKAKSRALRDAQDADLKKILTDAQYTKYIQNRPQRKERN